MKIEFELKPLYVATIILLLFLTATSLVGLKRVSALNNEIESIDITNKELKSDIVILNKYKATLQDKVDSLEVKETYYKNKYYVTNKKLQQTLADYNSSDNDTKNKLFTDLIDN